MNFSEKSPSKWASFASHQRSSRQEVQARPEPAPKKSWRSRFRSPVYKTNTNNGTTDLPPPYTTTPISPQTLPHHQHQHQPAPPTAADQESAYSFLNSFDTIFLVDDSTSMKGPNWTQAANAIAAIAPICTSHDPDGIDIYFLNQPAASNAHYNITTPGQVHEIFTSVTPRGATPIGKRLNDILKPYMARVDRMHAAQAQAQTGAIDDDRFYVRPVNIIVITDGVFTDDAESVIMGVARKLDLVDAIAWQVGIQFFQVGEDESARLYLQELDDFLGGRCREGLRDIVDTVSWGNGGLCGDGILKTVLGAVNKRLDRRVLQ
ncbi:uncharacterized protein N7511_008768 [Penicillium nucicola]|uniref:uncharacterized protein n=1 Tax=Penicillium nucicola TaxID=1850975 RepID=UPI002545B3C6|nr:uncharacterized protein N7511_008768 [Penicillium nucicola]KAJ5747072.1 hypothetical protein N7511_008768 [Penicillium nucicola]